MNTSTSDFRFNYNDAWLINYRLGPRRELHLLIYLDSIWNPGLKEVTLRFAAIDNFEEVVRFFATIPLPPAADRFIGEIDQLQWSPAPAGFLLGLNRAGSLLIQAQNFAETCSPAETQPESVLEASQ